MDRSNISEAKFVTHPDLVDLDVGMRWHGVLKLSNRGNQYAVNAISLRLDGLPAVDMDHLLKQTAQQDIPEGDLRLTGFHQPIGIGASFGLIEKFVLRKCWGVDHPHGNG